MAALEKVAKVQRSLSLRLYKAILASHRQLPPEMRLIGDLYVREEFQRHKTAKPEHLRPFFEQWLQCPSLVTCSFLCDRVSDVHLEIFVCF